MPTEDVAEIRRRRSVPIGGGWRLGLPYGAFGWTVWLIGLALIAWAVFQ